MSGHSKWHQIRHKKGLLDKKKGQLFSKISRMIQIAARNEADSEKNFRLRLAIEKAKEINMPKDAIERAIKKGSGQIEGEKLEEFLLEGYGPLGIALLIEVLTDNRNRATAEVRATLTKFGGSLGETRCVLWMFSQKGILGLEDIENKERVELLAIDGGAEDIEEENSSIQITVDPKNLSSLKNLLEKNNIKVSSSEILMIPTSTVKIEDEKQAQRVLKLMEALEDLGDVQKVHSNFDIPQKIMEAVL